MGRHRRKVWTVVGLISDDLSERFNVTNVYRGDVAQRRVPNHPMGWGYVVDAATRDAAQRAAQRLHLAYLAGTLDYAVTMVHRGPGRGPEPEPVAMV